MILKIKSEFNEKGFTICKDVISKDLCKKLIERLTSIEDRPEFRILKPRIHFNRTENGLINSLHRIDEWGKDIFPEVLNNTAAQEIASSLIGDNVELFSAQAFMKPASEGMATPAHQDNWYWCFPGYGGITIWISLSGASRENGGLSYQHKDKKVTDLIEHIPSDNTPGSSWILPSDVIKEKYWVTPELTPGDSAIHNGLVIHRSTSNTSPLPRIGFLLNYKPVDSIRDDEAFKKQQDRLKKMSYASK
jgi:phytanoyl-CoA hydroxylase